MTTAQDMYTDALRQIGVLAISESPSSYDNTICLKVLNDMLDLWSNESLICYAYLQQSLTLVPGEMQYSIGPFGDVNGQRPIRLRNAAGSAYITDSNNNKYWVDVVDIDQWNQRTSGQVSSNVPDTLWYDSQEPLGFLNFFPNPNVSYTANWTSYLQLVDFTFLSSAVSMPPGYVKAIQDNLAEQIWPYYKSKLPIPQDIIRRAALSKGIIKRSNSKILIAQFEREMLARASGTYDIYNDGYNQAG